MPLALRRALSVIFGAIGWETVSMLLGITGAKAAHELWALHGQRNVLIDTVTGWWREQGLDGVVCPAHVLPACETGKTSPITIACSYTAVYNLLNFPAGVVPVTRQTAEDEANLETEYEVGMKG
jgi:fatty acid amide hydrolase